MSMAIRVDDTDPNVQYSGIWLPISATSKHDHAGNFGQPFQGTLHSASFHASLTYNFTGYSVLIVGTIPSANVTDFPSFHCSIDGESFQTGLQLGSGNVATLCSADLLSEGPHTLEFFTKSSSPGSFLLDYIQYVPSTGITPADHATVVIQHADPQLHSAYDAFWDTAVKITSAIESIGAATRTMNSTFEFLFNGTSLSWYGFYDDRYPAANTTAVYSVDDQPTTQFPLRNIANNYQLSQIFFRTARLPQTQHKLVVMYEGNDETTPLSLETLIIEDGSIIGGQLRELTLAPSSAAITPTANSVQRTSSVNPNAIVGGVIGGVAIILFGIFVVILLRIRAISRYRTKAPSQEFTGQSNRRPTSYTPAATPFTRSPSIHKPKQPPARYMPPLSTAGSMRSYDPPSTIPSLPESGSPSRGRYPDSTFNNSGPKRHPLPRGRSIGSSQRYIALNSIYKDNTEDLKLDTVPESTISATPTVLE